MLTCKEATRLCSEELDRELDLRERLTLRMHLMMCTGCTHFRTHMHALRRATRAFAEGKPNAGDGEEFEDGDPPLDGARR